jgi:hypothetical protein
MLLKAKIGRREIGILHTCFDTRTAVNGLKTEQKQCTTFACQGQALH